MYILIDLLKDTSTLRETTAAGLAYFGAVIQNFEFVEEKAMDNFIQIQFVH